jgi:glutamate dehydrogenase (NAD(P)+)
VCDITCDELGPSKVIQLYFPTVDRFRAIVVVDNTALGPAIGGVRVSPEVTVDEVMRLARTMTMKNSIAGLPHGGGKAGIVRDPRDPRKEEYVRAFARAIKGLAEYIPGPDMGSDEQTMAWVYEETGRAVGLPEEMGGIPLDKLGATGYGLAECAEVACPYAGVELKGARMAVQGFGSVGRAVAKFLSQKGAVLVAASDTKGTIHDPGGIDVEELLKVKASTGSVVNYKKGKALPVEEVFSVPCDIIIPAAVPDVIHRGNIGALKARLILQGANIPVTLEAEAMARERGILSVPDFIANAGGVIMAAMEYARKTEKEAFETIASKVRSNTEKVLEKARAENVMPREAARALARERVLGAMY